jgi:beta-carotene ketolase (CrtW type)
MEPYKARSQKRNHLGAFFCCYFFGYHYEHHAFPETPWWRLYKKKN